MIHSVSRSRVLPARERAGAAPLEAPARTLCWAEAHIARRNAAIVFLTSKGLRPQRKDRVAEVPLWIVPGWASTFTDTGLVELAERHGWKIEQGGSQ
ncbi:hypothetical protein [Sphingosinicella sp. BN140058]|uniref:hypothetical protein n=1 Tax=Sphingosinicella sp. BN140058 TaxID=1892855 RepID=UPI0010115E22|nr:hypothetical protein [Sphingosinicella sp. BN140058]QAY77904.1 hypothetical protein ETR14_16285 [Sphingosinicella sp. BN140058]